MISPTVFAVPEGVNDCCLLHQIGHNSPTPLQALVPSNTVSPRSVTQQVSYETGGVTGMDDEGGGYEVSVVVL